MVSIYRLCNISLSCITSTRWLNRDRVDIRKTRKSLLMVDINNGNALVRSNKSFTVRSSTCQRVDPRGWPPTSEKGMFFLSWTPPWCWRSYTVLETLLYSFSVSISLRLDFGCACGARGHLIPRLMTKAFPPRLRSFNDRLRTYSSSFSKTLDASFRFFSSLLRETLRM